MDRNKAKAYWRRFTITGKVNGQQTQVMDFNNFFNAITEWEISSRVELPVMQKIASIIDNKISELRMENRDSSELTSNNIYEWTACIGILNEIKNEIASNFSA